MNSGNRAHLSDELLNGLRAVPILSVAQRYHKLRKEGREYRAEDDHSLTFNAEKNVWLDRSTDEGGNVIQLVMHEESCPFLDAAARVAEIGGIALPGESRSGGGNGPLGPSPPAWEPPQGDGSPRHEMVATYDYTDADGGLIYQVCRFEWIEDGKRRKSFKQRRKVNDDWVWNLDGIEHGLYRLPQLRKEMLQPVEEQRTIYLPEGEKDVETLVAWGCASKSSRSWTPSSPSSCACAVPSNATARAAPSKPSMAPKAPPDSASPSNACSPASTASASIARQPSTSSSNSPWTAPHPCAAAPTNTYPGSHPWERKRQPSPTCSGCPPSPSAAPSKTSSPTGSSSAHTRAAVTPTCGPPAPGEPSPQYTYDAERDPLRMPLSASKYLQYLPIILIERYCGDGSPGCAGNPFPFASSLSASGAFG
jgi:hypothetical protein